MHVQQPIEPDVSRNDQIRLSDIVGTAKLEDNAPEGAASEGRGKLSVNNESKNTIQVLDARTMKVLASWPISPCDGPTVTPVIPSGARNPCSLSREVRDSSPDGSGMTGYPDL